MASKPLLSLALLLLLPLSAAAQLIVPDKPVKLGERIPVVCQLEEGDEVTEWGWLDAAGFEKTGENRILVFTTTPGTKQATCKVTNFSTLTVLVQDPKAPDDKSKAQWKTLKIPQHLKQHVGTFSVVGGKPGPEPEPDPDPDPEPKPGTLGALVPDPKHRAMIAEYYADWATNIRSGAITTTGNFRDAHARSSKLLKDSGKLPDAPALNQPISDRLAAAIGLADAPLDATKREALAKALDGIAAELRGL